MLVIIKISVTYNIINRNVKELFVQKYNLKEYYHLLQFYPNISLIRLRIYSSGVPGADLKIKSI